MGPTQTERGSLSLEGNRVATTFCFVSSWTQSSALVVMSTLLTAVGPSEGPTVQPSKQSHVFAPYLPRAVTGRSARFVEHDDAVVAAIDALNVDQLLLLLNQAGSTIPFWRCLRSLCHAYPTPNPPRWEQMTALVLHAHIGTWCTGQPPPTERPQLNTSPNVRHLDNPLSSAVNQALLDDDCWDVKAFRVLLSLGVPFVDYLVWDELLERATTFKEHLRAIADHFGNRIFSQSDILQRLEELLHKLITLDHTEDVSHEMEAAMFLMRILFRWFLKEINMDTWMHELKPLSETLALRSCIGGPSTFSSDVPSVSSLEDLLKQVFHSLSEEKDDGNSIVHLTFPKFEKTRTTQPWIHLILDIDGTLIDDDATKAETSTRPYLQEFLRDCFEHCASVSLWTAASQEWLIHVRDQVLAPLLPEDAIYRFTWHGNRCSRVSNRRALLEGDFYAQRIVIKRLRKTWRGRGQSHARHTTLIVDDTPRTYTENYGNAIPVPKWKARDDPNRTDTALQHLAAWIRTYSASEAHEVVLRQINKMRWHCTLPHSSHLQT